jgi:hypothetical protein
MTVFTIVPDPHADADQNPLDPYVFLDPLDRGADPDPHADPYQNVTDPQPLPFYVTFFKVGWICLNVFCRLLRGGLSAVDVRILADYVRRYNKLGLCSPGDQVGNTKSKCSTSVSC